MASAADRGSPSSPLRDAAATMVTIEEVARALDAAHRARIVHRDVKPANVLVAPNGRPVLLDLGVAHVRSQGLWELARPHMTALCARTGESCSVAQLDGSDVVYVARVAVPKIVGLSVQIGTRFPAVATSLGKVLLAALLAPLCEAARSTWSAEMAEGKDTACFEKPAPASAAAAARAAGSAIQSRGPRRPPSAAPAVPSARAAAPAFPLTVW